MDASAARFAHHAIDAFSRRPLRHPSRPRGSRERSISPPFQTIQSAGERGRFWRKGRLSPSSEVRLDLFATPSVNVHNLRTEEGWSRRKAVVAPSDRACARVMLFLPVVPQQRRSCVISSHVRGVERRGQHGRRRHRVPHELRRPSGPSIICTAWSTHALPTAG